MFNDIIYQTFKEKKIYSDTAQVHYLPQFNLLVTQLSFSTFTVNYRCLYLILFVKMTK